jgi:hypothetical protein
VQAVDYFDLDLYVNGGSLFTNEQRLWIYEQLNKLRLYHFSNMKQPQLASDSELATELKNALWLYIISDIAII